MIRLDNPALRLALVEIERMNHSRRWATLFVEDYTFETLIYIKTGPIHTNGMEEQATLTKYYTVGRDGNAHVHCIVHP